MNVFHFHLTEDHGYRIAFDGYPELNDFGGATKMMTTTNENSGSGLYDQANVVGTQARFAPGSIYYSYTPDYYTREDFQEIIDYAEARYVAIVPEIEFPGHSYSQNFSLPLLNNGKPYNTNEADFPLHQLPNPALTWSGSGTNLAMWAGRVNQSFSASPMHDTVSGKYIKAYIDDIFAQLAAMLPPRSQYIHYGGDEVGRVSHADYCDITSYISDTINSHGLQSMQWNQGSSNTTDFPWADVTINYWNGNTPWDYTARVVRDGAKVLASISSKAYVDIYTSTAMPMGLSWPRSAGVNVPISYQWDPEHAVPEEYRDQGYVIGVEASLWGETIGREPTIDWMAYPRLPSYAEIGWSPKEERYNGTGGATLWTNYSTGNPVSTPAWEDYKARLASQGIRLTYQGVTYFAVRDRSYPITST
jgi:hexosaminidase